MQITQKRILVFLLPFTTMFCLLLFIGVSYQTVWACSFSGTLAGLCSLLLWFTHE